jgi:Protein of unknown function (DUF3313)
MFRLLSLAIAACAPLLLASCVIAPKSTDSTPDGLVRVQSKRVDMLFIAPGMSLSRYKRVMFDNVDVAFKADWQVNHPNIPPEDIANIRYGAASIFRTVFAEELEKGGYAIAETPGPDVLRVSASIVDLGIVGGSTAGTEDKGHGYIVSTADMSLVAELRDSQSGANLARAVDRKRGRSYGNLQVADQASNTAEARQAFALWASYLRDALDAARNGGKP